MKRVMRRGFSAKLSVFLFGLIAVLSFNAAAQKSGAVEYYNLGCKCAETDFDCRIENFSKAVELAPDLTEAFNNRGLAFSGKGDLENAIEDFNKTIELSPNFSKGFYNRAVLFARRNEFEKSISDFNKA